MKAEDKYKWQKHWWTRFFKFLEMAYDLLFLEPGSKASWHPIKGKIPELIEIAWRLTMLKDRDKNDYLL